MYHLSLGLPDFPDDGLMTGAQFSSHISWPEGRPESIWGSAFAAEPNLEDMMVGEGDEEEEEPDLRWTQPPSRMRVSGDPYRMVLGDSPTGG